MSNAVVQIEADPFLKEIQEQPGILLTTGSRLELQREALTYLRDLLLQDAPLVLTGMGSSLAALTAFASVLNRRGKVAMLVNSAELLHFGLPLLKEGSVVVAVSQSGYSAEIVRLASLSKGLGVRLVSLTNGLENPLARAAEVALDMGAGVETGPSTKSFSATLVMLATIDRLLEGAGVDAAIRQVSDRAEQAALLISKTLEEGRQIGRSISDWSSGHKTMAFVGRGAGVAAASVGALIMKEAAQNPVIGMGTAEFRHGPFELAGPDLAVVVVSIEDATVQFDLDTVKDLKRAGGAVMTIGPSQLGSDYHMQTEAIEPLFDAIQAVVPLQLLAWAQASDRHDVPGLFKIGSKVTVKE
ncbi:MAG: SIS domain-containing protein [Cryobacterium sp.]|nr:SIS domain-containing protein [Cryobacterium sp.]